VVEIRAPKKAISEARSQALRKSPGSTDYLKINIRRGLGGLSVFKQIRRVEFRLSSGGARVSLRARSERCKEGGTSKTAASFPHKRGAMRDIRPLILSQGICTKVGGDKGRAAGSEIGPSPQEEMGA